MRSEVEVYGDVVAKQVIGGNLENLGLVIPGDNERTKVYKQSLLVTLQEEVIRLQNDIYLALHKKERVKDIGNLNFELLRLSTIMEIVKNA